MPNASTQTGEDEFREVNCCLPGVSIASDGRVRGAPVRHVVQLRVGSKRYISRRVSRLVATAFVINPRPDIFDMVDHIDGNTTNNHWTNLRWVNHQLNCMNMTRAKGWCKTSNKKNPYQVNYQRKHIGCFATPEEAHAKYKEVKHKAFKDLYTKLTGCESCGIGEKWFKV